MNTRKLVSLALLGALMAGCSAADRPRDWRALPELGLSDDPTLEIGLVEGDEDYLFQDVTSVVRLASGNLVVADGGSSELALYAPDGSFVRRWGGRGEGPGEFRSLSRVYPLGPDSLIALDQVTSRLSVFDTAGVFVRQVALADYPSDPDFPMDVWLYRRYWIDGAPGEAERARVRAVLDGLPPPRSGPGYRVVRVVHDGRLWIREPEVSSARTRAWTVTAPDGAPEAVIDVPVDFEPLTNRADEVLGRWTGESDVHFVRAYRIGATADVRTAPAWMLEPSAEAVPAPDEEAFMTAIRTAIRALAVAEEIHYSTAMTYTARLDSLDWERPEGVVVDLAIAGSRGWGAVFTHPGLDRICALFYGYTMPPGWAPGKVVCGPSVPAAGTES